MEASGEGSGDPGFRQYHQIYGSISSKARDQGYCVCAGLPRLHRTPLDRPETRDCTPSRKRERHGFVRARCTVSFLRQSNQARWSADFLSSAAHAVQGPHLGHMTSMINRSGPGLVTTILGKSFPERVIIALYVCKRRAGRLKYLNYPAEPL